MKKFILSIIFFLSHCPVWSFTLNEEARKCNPPRCPNIEQYVPNNINLKEDSVSFKWESIAEATSYDFYFGESKDNLSFYQNISTNSCRKENLLSNKTYYWKIVPKNSCGQNTECPTLTFRTTEKEVEEQKNSTAQNTEAKPSTEKENEEVKVSTMFSPEKSSYLTYNIFNVITLSLDVDYSSFNDEKGNKIAEELTNSYFGKYSTIYDEENFKKFVIYNPITKESNLNWEELEKLVPYILPRSRIKYFKDGMKSALAVPVKDVFEGYYQSKKAEITDAVFKEIKWPKFEGRNKHRKMFSMTTDFDPFKIGPYIETDTRYQYDRYRLGGVKLDLRAGQDVIAPPASIVFDIDYGPFFLAKPWFFPRNDPNSYKDWKIAYLKVGPLYLEVVEAQTYTNICEIKVNFNYNSIDKGLHPLLLTDSFLSSESIEYTQRDNLDTIGLQLRKAFDDMKFVRIFSFPIFRDSPKIRAYGVMVPPGIVAGVRDSYNEEVPKYDYVKNTKKELDYLSEKNPNIKEVCIREGFSDPDIYGEWGGKIFPSGIRSYQSYYGGGLFIVYPTKTDGTEWAAEIVNFSINQKFGRTGLGAVYASSWIFDGGDDGLICYDKVAPTHWYAVLMGDPKIITNDYELAIERPHFLFSEVGILEFEKDEKGNIKLTKRYDNIKWYPAEIEKKLKEMEKW